MLNWRKNNPIEGDILWNDLAAANFAIRDSMLLLIKLSQVTLTKFCTIPLYPPTISSQSFPDAFQSTVELIADKAAVFWYSYIEKSVEETPKVK